MHPPIRVLFLCDGNADRSQMAEALLRSLGNERFEAFSAGIEPAPLSMMTVSVMREIGIDIAQSRTKNLNEFEEVQFDYVVTLCEQAKSSCLTFPRDSHNEHWQCMDPAAVKGGDAEQLAAFRQSREEIKTLLLAWISKHSI